MSTSAAMAVDGDAGMTINPAFAAMDSDLTIDLKRYNQRREYRREVAL